MGELTTGFIPKTRSYPFRTRHDIRTAQPNGEKDHHEDLVPYRPKPRNPGTFESIDKEDRHRPHRAGNIEHTRGVRQTEKIPFNIIVSQEIGG